MYLQCRSFIPFPCESETYRGACTRRGFNRKIKLPCKCTCFTKLQIMEYSSQEKIVCIFKQNNVTNTHVMKTAYIKYCTCIWGLVLNLHDILPLMYLGTFALIVCAQRYCAVNATVICHALLRALAKLRF